MITLYLLVTTTCFHLALSGHLYSPQAYAPVAYAATPAVALSPPPLHYPSPLRTSVGYGPLAAARLSAPHVAYTPSASVSYSPAPVGPVAPAVSYAAFPSVSHVPVTRYEAQPGYIQKLVDVAHPKVATRKIQIRRPAIQKQFYDIEERIIVRPVGSAVVELEQPLSQTQAGPTLLRSALPAVPVYTSSPVYGPPTPPPPNPGPFYGPPSTPAPIYGPPSSPPNPEPIYGPPSTPPPPPQQPEFPQPNPPQEQFDDTDSITVDSPVRSRNQGPQRFQPSPQSFQPQSPPQSFQPSIPQPQGRSRPEERQEEQTSTEQEDLDQTRNGDTTTPSQTEVRYLSRSNLNLINNFLKQSPQQQLSGSSESSSRSIQSDVIPSSRSSQNPEESQINQQRLIDLLTARGGVTELRSGVTVENLGQGGQVRARVLSVTPAPPSSDSTDERVSTRRLVVSRPIQTLQEVDVVQPFVKVERVSVQQPAVLKTARVDLARVNTLTPVPVASYAPYSLVH